MEKKITFAKNLIKTGKSLLKSIPIILGTVLLVSLTSLIPQSFYLSIFNKNIVLDSIMGSIIGSVSLGTPIVSYILGGELLKQGVSLLAVTSFLISWVTVGIVQLPAESMMLSKKFAIIRNVLSFISSIIIAIITVLIYNLI